MSSNPGLYIASCSINRCGAYLGEDRGVLRLHHGVDDGLRVDDDVDVVVVGTEQVVRFDHLRGEGSHRSARVKLRVAARMQH